jgi:hypothetical protein
MPHSSWAKMVYVINSNNRITQMVSLYTTGLPDAVTVTQITDTAMPMARLALSEKYDKPDDVTRKNKGAAKLARLVEVQASQGARVGTVTYKATGG